MSTAAATSASRIPFARAITEEAEIVSRALASESSCDISVIRDGAGFDALEVEWTALFERVGRPEQLFQTFEWLSCWADHFLDGADRLRIVIGRRDGRLVMVWPLVEIGGPLGFTKLAWMGEPVGQYGDALIEPGPMAREMLAAGWRAVRALKADAALLRKTRADSNVSALLGEEALICEQTVAPFARFGGKADFTAALSHRSAKTQSSRRRLLRRLKETGDIAFESGADSASAQKLLRRAFEMKREWLLRRGLYSGPIESDAMLAFFVDFATRAKTGDDLNRCDPPRWRSRFDWRDLGLQGRGLWSHSRARSRLRQAGRRGPARRACDEKLLRPQVRTIRHARAVRRL